MYLTLEPAIAQRAQKIEWLLLDVDGVMSDGALYFSVTGESLKRYYVHDGLGIRLLQAAGIKVAILSARDSFLTTVRAQDLHIDVVIQGSHDKSASFTEFLATQSTTAECCAFMGDDVIDIAVLYRVGLACAPANAHPAIKPYVHYYSRHNGGQGAIREVCDLLLQAQNKWDGVMQRYVPQH